MAGVVKPVSTGDPLAGVAEFLEAEAEQLRKQARLLTRKAKELRALEGVAPAPLRLVVPPEPATVEQRITTVLAEAPLSIPRLAARLETDLDEVRRTVRAMHKRGELKQFGIKRGTRYALASDTSIPLLNNDAFDSYTLVRDTARALGSFSVAQIQADLPLSTGTLERRLRELVKAGTLRVETRRRSNGRLLPQMYHFVRPTNSKVERRKLTPPEAQVVARNGLTSGPVAGTGRGERATRHDVRQLLDDAAEAGAEIEKASKHWKVLMGGIVLATVPSTPSDHRSLLNCRAELRRKGLELR